MKTNTLALCALLATLSLTAYRSAYSDEPTPPATPDPVVAVVTPAVLSDPLTPRQEVALNATIRLDQLDDSVAELKARCDEKSTCASLVPGFKNVATVRLGVLSALTNLRDPEIGFEATATSVRDSLSALDIAIQSLTRQVAELSQPTTSITSHSEALVAQRELGLLSK